jgi:hypothetical protein
MPMTQIIEKRTNVKLRQYLDPSFKPGCYLRKSAHKSAGIYALARELIMVA